MKEMNNVTGLAAKGAAVDRNLKHKLKHKNNEQLKRTTQSKGRKKT